MARELNTGTLNDYSRLYAAAWLMGTWPGWPARDRAWMVKEIQKFNYKDEWNYLVDRITGHLYGSEKAEFEAAVAGLRKNAERKDDVFQKILAEKLAIDVDGNHLPGFIGNVQVGGRPIGTHMIEVETPESIRWRKRNGKTSAEDKAKYRRTHMRQAKWNWPLYAGEGNERAANSGVADPLPPGTPPLPVGALNTSISNEIAILGLDALLDGLDEGTAGAIISGYTTAQATDADTAIGAQTKCFNTTCAATAFLGATDGTGSATASADTIVDDSSADSTQTLAWCRASSSSVADTALDDHIDGEAGTSGADWTFNTLSIVSGSTVSMSSWVVTLPE